MNYWKSVTITTMHKSRYDVIRKSSSGR